MSILPPASGPWRTQSDGGDLVHVRTTRHGDREVTIRPGADRADVSSAMATLPVAALFAEAFGDVDVTLVFRAVPDEQAIVPATVPTGPLSAPAAVTAN
jgi:uncharacterized repeat protein (TIGR03917 family)